MQRLTPITKFESLVRRLVEGSFDRLLTQTPYIEILEMLCNEMTASLEDSLVANNYVIHISEDQERSIYEARPNIILELTEYLKTFAAEEGYILAGDLRIETSTSEDADTPITVSAVHTIIDSEPTAHRPVKEKNSVIQSIRRQDAYLIVNGKRHFSLVSPVTSIGRHLDNDVVLEDSKISRRHAQIRWKQNRFILVDLGSKAGTFVNEVPISESVLQSGDIIKFGSVVAIFGIERDDISPDHPLQNGDKSITIAFKDR